MVIEKKSTGPDPDPTEFLFVSLEQKRIDQTKPYDAKKACWVPDDKEGFILGEIRGTKGDLVTVGIPGGEVCSNYHIRDNLSLHCAPFWKLINIHWRFSTNF
jgi:hypothetical protein